MIFTPNPEEWKFLVSSDEITIISGGCAAEHGVMEQAVRQGASSAGVRILIHGTIPGMSIPAIITPTPRICQAFP